MLSLGSTKIFCFVGIHRTGGYSKILLLTIPLEPNMWGACTWGQKVTFSDIVDVKRASKHQTICMPMFIVYTSHCILFYKLMHHEYYVITCVGLAYTKDTISALKHLVA